jgi:hypothetical protein
MDHQQTAENKKRVVKADTEHRDHSDWVEFMDLYQQVEAVDGLEEVEVATMVQIQEELVVQVMFILPIHINQKESNSQVNST